MSSVSFVRSSESLEMPSLSAEELFFQKRWKKVIRRAHKNRGKPPLEWRCSRRFSSAFEDFKSIKPVSLALPYERYRELSRKTKQQRFSPSSKQKVVLDDLSKLSDSKDDRIESPSTFSFRQKFFFLVASIFICLVSTQFVLNQLEDQKFAKNLS